MLLLVAQLPFGIGARVWLASQYSFLGDYNDMATWINDNKSNYFGDAAASDYPHLHGTLNLGLEPYVDFSAVQVGLDLGFLSAATHYKTQGTNNAGYDYTWKEDWNFKAIPIGFTLYYKPVLGVLLGAGAALYKSSFEYYGAVTYPDIPYSSSAKANLSATKPGFHVKVGYLHRLDRAEVGVLFIGRYAKISGYKGKATVSEGGDSRTEDVQLGFQEDQEYTGYVLADEGTAWQANQRDGVVDFTGFGIQITLGFKTP